jgi:hypothetical protein
MHWYPPRSSWIRQGYYPQGVTSLLIILQSDWSVSIKYAFNQLKIRFRVPRHEMFSVFLHSPTERKRPRGARRLRLLRCRLIRLYRLHLVFLVLHLHCMGSQLLSPTISPRGMFGMAAPIRTATPTLTSGQLLMRSPWSARSKVSSVRAWLARCWRRLVRPPSIRLWLCYRWRLLWLLDMGTPSSKAVVLCRRP